MQTWDTKRRWAKTHVPQGWGHNVLKIKLYKATSDSLAYTFSNRDLYEYLPNFKNN